MKMAPLVRAFDRIAELRQPILVHTGQHYDIAMNEKLFADLGLPEPDVNLEVGSASHAVQTAEIMRRFEPVLESYRPRCVVVVGDVNSTLACALVAVKNHVPVVHVEAGLRSFDRSMPEEINRVLTDQISELLYTTERSSHANLAREGIDMQRVHFVGNVMIDSLLMHRERAPTVENVLSLGGASARGLSNGVGYGVVTLHRPSNVDRPEALREALVILRDVSERLPLLWAMHPRTRASVERFGFEHLLDSERVILLAPQGYLEMLALLSTAKLVLTDSGGIQEETTALSVPCLTMRDTTERPITVEQGTNVVVGRDRDLIISLVDDVLTTGGKRGRIPELWDGRAAERIAEHLGDLGGRARGGEGRPAMSAVQHRKVVNALTVDVEDYFQVSALAPHIPRSDWNHIPCRIERNIDVILALLDESGSKATFFTLGWIAERYPHTVRTISRHGHEVASHGYGHQRATEQTRTAFLGDIRHAKRLLEELCGQEVKGYRAPSFSIGPQNQWAFDCILEAEYRYSSSVYPVRHDHYGMPDAPRFSFQARNGLLELPVTTSRMLRINLPAGGGGYFRMLPYPVSKWLIQRVNRLDKQPAIFYFHPWEVDAEQPRVPGLPVRARFRHYVNLHRTEQRLRRLLEEFAWNRMDRVFLSEAV